MPAGLILSWLTINVMLLVGFSFLIEFQREDWRQRPLPVEMMQYARIDAHYLLYIAYCLASELKHLPRGMPFTMIFMSYFVLFLSLC